jgi:hypothetical protein
MPSRKPFERPKKKPEPREITVLWVPVGKDPVMKKIQDTLPDIYRHINGGPMECIPFTENVNIVWNELANTMNPPLPLNRSIWNGEYTARGDFFFTRITKGKFVGITEFDAARLIKELL